MPTIYHASSVRKHAQHGWLDAYRTFSFSSYADPSRMNFGVLCALNDDNVAPTTGFGMHPHDNMEIITIPLAGSLAHKDNMGNASTIRFGDIQVMSAGTGVVHSEFNPSADEAVNFLQIWAFPNQRDVPPRYQQHSFAETLQPNHLQQILSPSPEDEGVWIYQNAWFHFGKLDEHFSTTYHLKDKSNGVYIFVISGQISVEQHELSPRDGFGIWEVSEFDLTSQRPNTEVLLMEVPMRQSDNLF